MSWLSTFAIFIHSGIFPEYESHLKKRCATYVDMALNMPQAATAYIQAPA